MFDVQTLRVRVQQRLTAAAEDVLQLIERTVAEYQEALSRQQDLLDAVLKPRVILNRADGQLLPLRRQEAPPEQQDRSPSLGQDDPPELPRIKEEQEDPWTSREEEQLQGLEEDEVSRFTFSPDSVKSEEDDEDSRQSSQLHQAEGAKKESDGDDGGSPQPDGIPDDGHRRSSSEPHSASNSLIDVGEKLFMCSMCGKRFSDNSNLKRHTRIHTGEKPFSCTVCSRSFIQKVHLKRHMMRHLVPEPYSCSLRPKRFILQAQLRNHQRGRRLSSGPDHRQAEQPTSGADGEEPGQVFNPDSLLQPATGGGRDREETGHPQPALNDGQPECGPGPAPVVSPGPAPCSGLVDQQDSGVQPGVGPFSCSVCRKTFKCKYNFLTHMRVHTGERPFSCAVCGKTFAQSSALNLHLRVHTGEKPFCCSLCPAAFSFGSNLTQHMRVHTGEKPFCCSVCSKGFSRNEQLKQHLAVHTGEKPFSCSVCSKAFAVSSALTSHTRVHTGEKPFSCSVCQARFGFRSNLSTHMRTHGGGRRPRCPSCQQTFTHVAHIRSHQCPPGNSGTPGPGR